MSRPAISVRDLSKRYRIGEAEARQDTLAGAIFSAVRRPFGNLRRLRRLARFGETDAPDVIWALRDINLEVEQGEVIGIIGRNGAGKSTLLKVLSRITAPTTGRIELTGRVASLLEVGTGFHPELTGRENVYLNGTILGMRKAEVDARLAEIIDFSGIEKFIDTPLKRYSSGMAVRLAFSVAAHLEPEILLIDEVLAVGDAEFREKCLGKMQAVADQGRTVLFVSHNLSAVTQLCRRTVLLEDGRVAAEGATETVVASYLSTSHAESGERLRDEATAPGDETVRLRAVRVRSNGTVSSTADVAQPLELEIEYSIMKPVKNLRLGFNLASHLGVVVFTSGDETALLGQRGPREPGTYRSICSIPADLLNTGRYSVNIVADIPFVRLIFCEVGALSFDTARTTSRGAILPEVAPGLVAPPLHWRIQALEEVAPLRTLEQD